MPTRKPARRARRSAPNWRLPALEQRQLDLIGLGLVALGLFFAFLVYFGWDGGRAGSQGVEGLRWLLGAGHYLVPVALCAAGAILMLRPMLPAVRPFRSGAICLFCAVTLGLAAGTIGPGGSRPSWWDPSWVKTRGGVLGEALDWAVTSLAGSIGAHILAIFLFVAGALLVTGASVAGVIKATTDSVSTTTRELRTRVQTRPRRQPTEELERLERSTRVRIAERPPIEEPPEFDVWGDPLPSDDEAPAKSPPTTLRGPAPTTTVAGAPAAVSRARPPPAAPGGAPPRLAEDPAEDEPGVTRGPVEPGQLTPQGRYRRE